MRLQRRSSLILSVAATLLVTTTAAASSSGAYGPFHPGPGVPPPPCPPGSVVFTPATAVSAAAVSVALPDTAFVRLHPPSLLTVAVGMMPPSTIASARFSATLIGSSVPPTCAHIDNVAMSGVTGTQVAAQVTISGMPSAPCWSASVSGSVAAADTTMSSFGPITDVDCWAAPDPAPTAARVTATRPH